ncbi:MAG: hypothetical protein ACRAVC_24880 [Trichormus sp.]
MTDIKDLSQLIAKKGENPIIILSVNHDLAADAKLERELRELKFKQELRKNWILFIVRDVVIFSTIIFFILAASGYSLFMHIYR